METAPLFIIGTERSGSNLLRLILNSHSGITVPHPPHILKFFAPLEGSYGDLTEPKARRALVDDLLGLLAAHIYPWEFTIAPEAIDPPGASGPRSLVELFFRIYDEYRRQSCKRRWGCKSTFVIHHVERILAACPEAKFILLVRDPRDVAVSSRRSIFSPFHPYFTARLWQEQQAEGLRWLESEAKDHFHLLRYEELIEQPAEAIQTLCRFLGEEYEPGMLEYHTSPAAQKSSRLSSSWRNVGSPIQKGNSNTFRTGLSQEEIRLVEGVTGELMTRFGYSPESSSGSSSRPWLPPSPLTLVRFTLLDCIWRMGMEWHALRHDRNYPLHWRRRFFLARLQLRRRMAGLLAARRGGRGEGARP